MHYFENNQYPVEKKRIFCNINGRIFQFITASGVFSKDQADQGTLVLIKNVLKKEKINDKKILDVGCGYGIIGIILKAFGAKTVHMCDINKLAIKLAKENAKLNNVKIEKIENKNIFDFNENEKYDLIICNPPIHMGKETIYKMIDKMYDLLKDGGKLYFVLMTRHGGKSHYNYFKEKGYKIEEIDKESGYRIFKIVK